MRQTSIGTLPLPEHARVSSYSVHVDAPTGRELPVSFDQHRHVAVGSRPGSWMGVAFTPAGLTAGTPVDRDLVAAAWMAVIARHGTLQTVFSTDDTTIRLHEAEILPGSWVDHLLPHDQTPAELVGSVLDTACSPYARPSHRLLLVESDDPPILVIGADHAHVDAWSMLVLLRDLQTMISDLLAGRVPGADLPPAATFAEHTVALAAQPPAPPEVTARWSAVLDRSGGVMPRFPLPLGDVSAPVPDVVEIVDVLDSHELAAYAARATDCGVRMLPLTLSVLAEVTRELSGQPLRAVMPVHSRHEERWRDAVGWFITNAVIEVDNSDVDHCAQALRDALALGSYALAPIMAAYGGMPVAPGMFALSWLDNRRLPVRLPEGLQPYQLSASMPTQGVMAWFLLNDHGMHVRCRYPDTPEARTSVAAWLSAVTAGIRTAAGAPPQWCRAA